MTHTPVRLRGTEDITIKVQVDAGWDPDYVRRVLVGGRWTLYADGRCTLVEGPAAAVHDDLYPLTGHWRTEGHDLVVNVRGTVNETTIAMDSRLSATQLHATHATRTLEAERVLIIRQTVVTDDRTDEEIAAAGPRRYAVTLTGHNGVRAFTGVSTGLVLRPPPGADRGPVSFSLGADEDDVNTISGICWMSHLDGDPSLRAYDTRITLSPDGLSAIYHSDDPFSIAVTWLPGALPMRPSAPVVAIRALLELRFAGRGVTGHVDATGGVFVPGPDGGRMRDLRYQAHITGELNSSGEVDHREPAPPGSGTELGTHPAGQNLVVPRRRPMERAVTADWATVRYRPDDWAVPDRLTPGDWLADMVAAAVSNGGALDEPRFLLARLHGHWITGVAYRPDRQYTFTGWTAPDSTSGLPDLADWEAHVDAWVGHNSNRAPWPEPGPVEPLVPNPTTASLGEVMVFPHERRHQLWRSGLTSSGPFVLVTGWTDLYALPLGPSPRAAVLTHACVHALDEPTRVGSPGGPYAHARALGVPIFDLP